MNQPEFVLSVLKDGHWHSHTSLYGMACRKGLNPSRWSLLTPLGKFVREGILERKHDKKGHSLYRMKVK